MARRRLVLVLCAGVAFVQGAHARDFAKQPLAVTTDLDRNGELDVARLNVIDGLVRLVVTLNSSPLPAIEIPVDGSQQFGICPGSPPAIGVVEQSEAPLNALGEMPHGYEVCPACMEIQVSGGDCDPLHFYWDATARRLAWWRA